MNQMEIKKAIEQLKDLRKDREAFADFHEPDDPFVSDIAAIDTAISVMEAECWIPCSVRKPANDSYKWAVGITSSGRCIAFQEHNAYENDTVGISVPTYLAHGSEITHWMPLPATPEVNYNVE